jgi:ribosomal protein S18 acetylase RimI-like enzyme
MATVVRIARPEEYDAIGALTAQVYVEAGFVPADSFYLKELRDAERRAGEADLLVAEADTAETAGSGIFGSVTYCAADSPWAELAGPGEAEFRMLVVDPAIRGRGIGTALVGECVRRARATGSTAVRLSTQHDMVAAHRLYDRFDFHRTPDRDWSPAPEVALLTYALDLAAADTAPRYCDRCGGELDGTDHEGCAEARRLEPARWCPQCRRRMVVQITPDAWTARCVEHGEVAG